MCEDNCECARLREENARLKTEALVMNGSLKNDDTIIEAYETQMSRMRNALRMAHAFASAQADSEERTKLLAKLESVSTPLKTTLIPFVTVSA